MILCNIKFILYKMDKSYYKNYLREIRALSSLINTRQKLNPLDENRLYIFEEKIIDQYDLIRRLSLMLFHDPYIQWQRFAWMILISVENNISCYEANTKLNNIKKIYSSFYNYCIFYQK